MADEEFEVFDYVGSRSAPDICLADEAVHHIYIDRRRYDVEVARGMETAVAAYNQLHKDMPRCVFTINGNRASLLDASRMPLGMVRYCTQAVMALPIEMLIHNHAIVAELPQASAMRVEVVDSRVRIRKKMRMFQTVEDSLFVPVDIDILVDLAEPTVSVTFCASRTSV